MASAGVENEFTSTEALAKAAKLLTEPSHFNWHLNGYITSDGSLGGVGTYSDMWTSQDACNGSGKLTGNKIYAHLSQSKLEMKENSGANAYTVRCVKD